MKRDRLSHLFISAFTLLSLLFPKTLPSQVTWDQTIDVASSSFGNNRPRITTNASGDPLIIWGKGSDLMYARWDGASFTTPIKLNPTGVTIATANWMGPEIASHGDTVYIVYKQTPEELVTSHIWCISSFDGGVTFNEPTRVEDTGNDKSRFPTVTIDEDGHPIVAYMRFNASFLEARWVVTRSFDYGATFTTDVLASGWSSSDSEVCDCCPGTIYSSGDIVAILYRDNHENLRDSWAGISNDGGLTFTKGVNIDQNGWMINACPSTGPDGVIIGDTLYSTFMSGASGTSVVYHNETPVTDLVTDTSEAVPGEGEGLQQNFARIASSGKSAAMLWRHSAESATGLALMFTPDIHLGYPGTFDTVAISNVVNGDVAMTHEKVMVTWQTNSGSNVKFRSGTYETVSASKVLNTSSILPLYPNPVQNEIFLPGDESSYQVTTLTGQRLLAGLGKRIDTSALQPGLYFVFTQDGYGKFVKQ